MVMSFVGGVRDAQGRRGYVEVQGEVVAVDLATGAMLWRRLGVGRPIAATAERLITLYRTGEGFILRLLDATTGADVARSEKLGMPDWAAEIGLAADAVQVEASEAVDGIRIQWRMRQPYRGGAAPPPEIAAKAREEATGGVIVDPNTAGLKPAVPESPTVPRRAAVSRPASADSSVFALDREGDRVFALEAKDSGVTLEARDARDNSVLWRLPLAAQRASHPPPLRK